jgi:Pretoxin HINT domain
LQGKAIKKIGGAVKKLAERIAGFGCSFAAGTAVTTEEGDKPIEQVKAGDKVLSRNERTGEQSYHRVLQTFATPDDEIYSLQLQTTDGKQETLSVTANHPFWLKGKGWTETDLLKSGDLIEAKDGQWLTVASVQPTQEKATGYNLEVETDHTYFVGNQQTLVHNACFPNGAPGEQAPNFVQPGVTNLKGEYNPTKRTQPEPYSAHYDEYGRQVGRTDYTDQPDPKTHTNPHHHTREYGPAYAPTGKETYHEGPHPLDNP